MNPFSPDQERALTDLLSVWPVSKMVLIGASALACSLEMRWRKSEDLDLTVSAAVDEYPAALAALPGWRPDPKQEQRWFAPGDVKVDIVPAGPALEEAGEIVWPRSGMRMSLVGLKLAFENNIPVSFRSGGVFQVATVPVVVILKMVAYLDRPAERGRDLMDLAYVLSGYVEDDLNRRFSPEVLTLQLDMEDVGPYLLGQDVSRLLGETERRAVNQALPRTRGVDRSRNREESRQTAGGVESFVTAQEHEIQRYLETGDHDMMFEAWSGSGLYARATEGDAALRKALIGEVNRRQSGIKQMESLVPPDLVAFTRKKITPMIRGLLPRSEQEVILGLLERSVVFLTPDTVGQVLHDARWLSTAWSVANLYLDSIGATLLSKDAPRIVGLSEETTCYVSLRYFGEGSPFADFIVHETAHVFHNCKRGTAGLQETRTREWLLNIDFRKRETFAYACEAYSRILEQGRSPAERLRLLSELEDRALPADEEVDGDEYVDILRDAVASRSGWKRILARCSSISRVTGVA